MLVEQDGNPIHYKTLTEAVQSSGVMDLKAKYTKPSDSVYGLLISASRHGTRVKFMGNGIFIAANSLSGIESVAIRPPDKPDSKPVKPLPVINGIVTCRYCRFFSTTQLQLLVGTTGMCGLNESGKHYTGFDDEACPGFAVKSHHDMELDHIAWLEGAELVNAVNIVQAKRPRRQDERA